MNENRFTAAPFKALIHSFVAAVLAAVLIFSLPPDNAAASSAVPQVSMPSQEEIVAYAQAHPTDLASYSDSGLPLNGYTISYRINPRTSSPFIAGALSDEELTCALNTVKTIRYIAGISDDVYLSDEYNSLAQASSLVNYVNNKRRCQVVVEFFVDINSKIYFAMCPFLGAVFAFHWLCQSPTVLRQKCSSHFCCT